MIHVKSSQLVGKYIVCAKRLSSPAQKKLVDMCAVSPSRESRILSLSLRPLSHSLPFRENPADMTSTKIYGPILLKFTKLKSGNYCPSLFLLTFSPQQHGRQICLMFAPLPYATLAPALWWAPFLPSWDWYLKSFDSQGKSFSAKLSLLK